jgi:hypothetical protein
VITKKIGHVLLAPNGTATYAVLLRAPSKSSPYNRKQTNVGAVGFSSKYGTTRRKARHASRKI